MIHNIIHKSAMFGGCVGCEGRRGSKAASVVMFFVVRGKLDDLKFELYIRRMVPKGRTVSTGSKDVMS